MPAVTPPDVSVLPRLSRPTPESVPRPVVSITSAPPGVEGEGFPVNRAFMGVDLALLDPFVHMDEMGAVEYQPGEPKGTPWHPHRGFETVTYMIDGTFRHQDSHGGGGLISNGDTQWMTAGSGLLHIEAPPEELVATGGLFHGLQLWVNLPRADKMTAPRYQDLRAGEVGLLATEDAAGLVRVIAGSIGGISGPGTTHTPMSMARVTIPPGSRLALDWEPTFNALAYVMSGAGIIGPQNHPIRSGQLAVFGPGDVVLAESNPRQDERHSSGLEVILLGGRPIREPVAWAGPFVMNTEAELRQAFQDAQAGRLGVVPTT